MNTSHTAQNFNLPKFRNKSSTYSMNWFKRLEEEKQKLEQLRTYFWEHNININLIKVQFDILNPRQIYCTIKISFLKDNPTFINFLIRLPLKYPFTPPKASDFSAFDFIKQHHDYKRWDNEEPEFKGFQFACLGELESRWEKDGSMGIAHYIQMLCYYAAFDHFSLKLID